MSVAAGPNGQVEASAGPSEVAAETGPNGQAVGSTAGAGDMTPGTGSGVDEAARLTAAAQARLDAGDRDGAIALYRRAFAALPTSIGHAQRRAAVALAIAAAEEAAFRAGGDPVRLRAALAAVDAYLAGLDPTDDENRAGAERRRSELSDMLSRAVRPQGPARAPAAAPARRGIERRAARAAAGLAGGAAAAGVVALAGVIAGRGADRYLARATARPCAGDDPADPCGSDDLREAIKADALADGVRANRLAVAGAAVAGALLAASAAALIAAAIRGRAPERVQGRATTLVVRF